MNLLIIFVLLFLFTLNVKGTHDNNTIQSREQKNSENSLNPECSDIQNTTKCENKSVSCQAAATDTNTGNQSVPEPNLKLDLRTVFIFLLGIICSTVMFSTVLCFVTICKRCRAPDANTENASLILEAVRSEHDQSMTQANEGQADEHDPLQVQASAEVSTNTSALNNETEEKMKILGKAQTEAAGEVTEVDYATINYSLLPKKDDGDLKPQNVESEYAEIQLNELNKGEEVQILQDEVKHDEMKQDKATQGQKGGMES